MNRLRPAVIFIFITLFLDVLGIGLIVPVLPKLVTELRGGNLAESADAVGWLGALFALMQFLFSPLLGCLSDRFGRRPVILLSLFGSAVDYLVLAWAPTFVWLVVARAISGFTAANFSAASAYIADVTPPEKRAAGFGLIGAAFGLGFIAGPALGGILGENDPRLPFLAAAGITFLNWLYGFFVLPESLAPENRRPVSLSAMNPLKAVLGLRRWPGLMGLAVSTFLANLAHNIYPSLWVLYTEYKFGWGSKMIGYSLGVVGITAAIVQGGLAGKIIGKLGEFRSLILGFMALGMAMIGYGLAPAGWVVFVIIVLGAIGGIAGPAEQSIMTQMVAEDEQGALQGSINSVVSLASIAGPPLWTSLFSCGVGMPQQLPGLPFLVAGVICFAGAWVAARALRGRSLPAAPLPPR